MMLYLLLIIIMIIRCASTSSDKGIIIPMGYSKAHFTGAWASIHIIRNYYNCSLPIELWSYEDEIELLPSSVIDKLSLLHDEKDVSLKVIPKIHKLKIKPVWDIEGEWYLDYIRFSSMPLALIHTQFQQVLAIDVDTLLFINPDILFQNNKYQETGTLYLWDKVLNWWPVWYPQYDSKWLSQFLLNFDKSKYQSIDNHNNHLLQNNPKLDDLLSSIHISPHIADSSLLLFNKLKNKRTLEILKDLTYGEYSENIYSYTYGDKETYWIASYLADSNFAFNDWGVAHYSLPTTIGKNGHPICKGDDYKEPGSVHYYPGQSMKILSMNECKGYGCVKFGLRRLRISKRLNRSQHVNTMIKYMKQINFNLSLSIRKPPLGVKSSVDGRKSIGVKHYHQYWYNNIKCDKFALKEFELLIKHREYAMEAGKLYGRKMRSDKKAKTKPKSIKI